MEQEQQTIPPEMFVAAVTQADNIADQLDENRLNEIGRTCVEDYERDKASMSDWFDKMKRGLALAQLVKEDKNYPFENASNVKFPLIASAALQYNARAYPAIVPPDMPVRAKVNGKDPDGSKAERGDRISTYMSHQLGAVEDEWEEETDKLLLLLPIVGDMYRKRWHDTTKRRQCSRLIEPGKFIVNKNTKTLADAPQCTEELPLWPHEIESRINSGFFAEFDYEDDKDKPQEFIEQHCRIDLDEDGYAEPYVVTVHLDNNTVVRVAADFTPGDVIYRTEERQRTVVAPVPVGMGMMAQVPHQIVEEVKTGIVAINRGSYFVHFVFQPSMDGSFHGMGLGFLLGDISDAINTIFNQLLDAGHYASLGGGFIGSGLRLKGGAQRMRPGEWKNVAAQGQSIRDSVVPMTFPGPDATLFSMLGLLIEAGREIASVKDVMTGDTGTKNMTATTTLALIEQGMMVFTASYKRVFRSLRKEYRLAARLNAQFLSPEEYNAFLDDKDQNGQPFKHDPRKDFGAADMDITPTADPRSVTKQQEAAKAQIINELAGERRVDQQESTKRILEAADIPDSEELLPQPDPMQMQMMQMQMQAAQADLAQKMADVQLTISKVETERAKAAETLAGVDLDRANQRLDAVKLILEHQREELDRVYQQGTARLEGKPGNGSPAQPLARPAGAGSVPVVAAMA